MMIGRRLTSLVRHILLLANVGCGVANVADDQSRLAADAALPRYIISDFDDTLQITNTTELDDAFINSVFHNHAYAAMNQLVAELTANGEPFTVVSGSPGLLYYKIKKFFRVNQFPEPTALILRGLGHLTTAGHKKAALRSIADNNGEQFILLGDDIQNDHGIYADFHDNYPDRVLAMYIHRVVGNAVDEDIKVYYTAFDVAYWEYRAQRMSRAAVEAVGKIVLEDSIEYVQPNYVTCPWAEDKLPIAQDDQLFQMYQSIWQRLLERC